MGENLDFTTELQSEDAIQQKWTVSLRNQPWYIKSIGNLMTPLMVSTVSRLQQKIAEQAFQMKWINDNALPMIEANQKVVDILGGSPLSFNNTRARYEEYREGNIWSASMDVSVIGKSSERKTGLVNAYFTPGDDIKILVVEIDDYMHNLTWKSLS